MAFANASGVPGANAQTNTGPDLQEVAVESLAFKTFAGETKIKLLPSPWLADALPSSTSSLFTISSKRGLLAAAGPNALVIAETKAVRDCFTGPAKVENNIKEFTPALTIGVPRLSQVAFNSNGAYLIISAESGGGLAIYSTDELLQNKKEPAFQIGTEGTPVRALAPNPAPEFAHFVAVVLGTGQLMIANLQAKEFITGANNAKVVKDGVTSVSWSNKGKQLVAGLHDGSAFQMDPAGSPKAFIQRPPNVPGNHHVSSLVWLANDEFLMIHTPTTPPDNTTPPDSIIHYVQTDKNRSAFNYQKVQDPAGPFGMNRVPPTHYIGRLRKWHHLEDMLILSAVVSTDVGLITRSEVPLTRDVDPSGITNVYTGTSFADDSQRASLPMSALGEMTDTSPIGMALDLSSKDKVPKPIPGDEMEDSPFPLPGLLLLNNEGVLCAWWVVNKDALRENKIYPGLMVAEGTASSSAPTAVSSPQTSAFGAPSALAGTSAFNAGFGKPAAPAFGQLAFGSAGNVGFGGTSAMGQKASPWGATGAGTSMAAPARPAFGAPSAFGAAAATGSAFGASGAIGQKASPWGTPASTGGSATSTTSPFGSAAGGASGFAKFGTNAPAASPFGSTPTGASGFAKFGSGTPAASPFGAMASAQSPTSTPAFATGGSIVGATPSTSFGMSTQPSFGSTVTIDSSTGGSAFGSKPLFGGASAQSSSLFGKPSLPQTQSQETDMMDDDEKEKELPKEEKKGGLFGLGPAGFNIGSTFKPDPNARDESDEEEKPKDAPRLQKPLFGADFGAALGDKQKSPSPQIKTEEEKPNLFSIPKKTDSQPKTSIFSSSSASPKSSLFGTRTESPKPSIFGSRTDAPKKSIFGSGTPSDQGLGFGKPSSPFLKEPEPPQVTSKPEPSPSATTAPSSESNKSSARGQESPLADSDAEAVAMPSSDDEESEEEPEVEREPALPPDPSTIKVSKDFYNFNPNAASKQAPLQPKPKAPVEEEAEVEPEAALPPDPSTIKVSKDFYNFNPNATSTQPAKPLPKPFSMPKAAANPFSSVTSTTPMGLPSMTPTGFPKANPLFSPPASTLREPPRSPSPQRSASTPIGKPLANHTQRPPSRPISRAAVRPSPPPPEPSFTASDLSDDEDERIREELARPIVPTLKLEPFVAHQDYAGATQKHDIGHSIERMYRDINSMVDTLGLNARSLANFIEGHNSLMQDERTKEDLDDTDDEEWCLVEVQDLSAIEGDLEQELDAEKIDDVKGKFGELEQLQKELGRIRHKLQDVRKFLDQSRHPARKASLKSAPLDPAHKALQAELRSSFAGLQAKLVQAEEGVLVAKTKLAQVQEKSGGGNVPTVEAVERTIRKMTVMAEKKSGDIDLLEVQMRRLGLATNGAGSGAGSPVRPGSRGMGESFRSSRGPLGESVRSSRFGESVRSSRLGESVRSESEKKGKTFAFPDQEDEEAYKEAVERFREGQRKKNWVLKTFAEAVKNKGVKVTQG